MLKLNSIICASVPLLGLDNELMSFGPAQCHLYLFSYGNFEIAEVFLTKSQGGPGVLTAAVPAPGRWPHPGGGRARAELTESGDWAYRQGPGALRKALGPLEAQAFLQAQLPEVEVEGCRASPSPGQVPRHEMVGGARVAWLPPGVGQRRDRSPSSQG